MKKGELICMIKNGSFVGWAVPTLQIWDVVHTIFLMVMSDVQVLIQEVDAADSSARLLDAVRNLAAARSPAAIPTLIATLSYNNPGAAVAAVEGLVQLGEVAVQPLLELLDRHNYSARAWAVRALAGIGDPRGLDLLLEAAQTDLALSVRRAAARGLGNLRWHALSVERVESAQDQALQALWVAAEDDEWIVRYAAVVGLQALAREIQGDRRAQIWDRLTQMEAIDESLSVRARIQWAMQQNQL